MVDNSFVANTSPPALNSVFSLFVFIPECVPISQSKRMTKIQQISRKKVGLKAKVNLDLAFYCPQTQNFDWTRKQGLFTKRLLVLPSLPLMTNFLN